MDPTSIGKERLAEESTEGEEDDSWGGWREFQQEQVRESRLSEGRNQMLGETDGKTLSALGTYRKHRSRVTRQDVARGSRGDSGRRGRPAKCKTGCNSVESSK